LISTLLGVTVTMYVSVQESEGMCPSWKDAQALSVHSALIWQNQLLDVAWKAHNCEYETSAALYAM
jgi:hypothetical protein